MALPGYLRITGSDQGPIEGECEAEGRQGTIVVQGIDHEVKLPTDSRGLPNGRRIHLPICITKDVDRTSPMLYQALSEGEILSEVVIEWYRLDVAGVEELYYKQTLKNAQITGIEFIVHNILDADTKNFGHHEKISLIYDDIIWSHEVFGIEYEDSFGS